MKRTEIEITETCTHLLSDTHTHTRTIVYSFALTRSHINRNAVEYKHTFILHTHSMDPISTQVFHMNRAFAYKIKKEMKKNSRHFLVCQRTSLSLLTIQHDFGCTDSPSLPLSTGLPKTMCYSVNANPPG